MVSRPRTSLDYWSTIGPNVKPPRPQHNHQKDMVVLLEKILKEVSSLRDELKTTNIAVEDLRKY